MRSPSSAIELHSRNESYEALPLKTRRSIHASDLLAKHTVIVTDPDDVYEISRNKRERNLRILIGRYVHQILHGCQNPRCTAPTCLSFQRRNAKGPLRKYTPLSARTLACFLVSEQDPEAGLCPNEPTIPLDVDAAQTSDKGTRRPPSFHETDVAPRAQIHTNGAAKHGLRSPTVSLNHVEGVPSVASENHRDQEKLDSSAKRPSQPAQINEAESYAIANASKDPKSFSQNLFDTLALRMLEWMPLRPRDTNASSREASESPQRRRERPSETLAHRAESGSITTRQTPLNGLSDAKGEIEASPVPEVAEQSEPAISNIREVSVGAPEHESEGQVKSLVANDQVAQSSIPTPDVNSPLDLESESGIGAADNELAYKKPVPRNRKPDVQPSNGSPNPAEISDAGTKPKASLPLTHDIRVPSLELLTRPIIRELLKIKLDNTVEEKEDPSRSKDPVVLHLPQTSTELTTFLRQSLFFVLKNPARLLRSMSQSLREQASDPLAKGILNLASTWYQLFPAEEIHQHLCHGLQSLQVPREMQAQLLREKHSSLRDSGSLLGVISENGSPERLWSDEDAAKYCAFVVYAFAVYLMPQLLVRIHRGLDVEEWKAFTKLRARGLSYDTSVLTTPETDEALIDLIDRLDNEGAVILTRRFVATIANRLAYYEMSKGHKTRGKLFLSKATRPKNILQLLFNEVADFRSVQHGIKALEGNFLALSLLERTRAMLLDDWDGKSTMQRSSSVGGAIQILAAMFEDKNHLGLRPDDFVTPVLSERLDPMEMPLEWQSFRANSKTIHLLSYSFLFPPEKVVIYFRAINFAAMFKAFEGAMAASRHVHGMAFRGMIHIHNSLEILGQLRPAMATYLVLQVRRQRVLPDAIDQLWRRERRELMRPLKVRMGMDEGEEGVDHGGVQQEFFRVVFEEALNPDLGMFAIDPTTRMTWFQPGSPEQIYKFEMLGVLMSLAVYNSLTLPVTFPIALYRKLLGLKVKKLDHIGDGWPELTRGLQDLLDWTDGDVSDIFVRTYEFTYEFAGKQVSVDMEAVGRDTTWPPRPRNKGKRKAKSTSFDFSSDHGYTGSSGKARLTSQSDDEDIDYSTSPGPTTTTHTSNLNPCPTSPAEAEEASLVTNSNRDRYVKDYIFWLTHKSISSQYEAFSRGFYTCLDRTALSIFTPEALKSVVEGIQEINIPGLQEATRYEDGFTKSHPYIKDFWSIISNFPLERKRQLLEFVTASDRVPVNGVKSIMFVIQRNGDGDERLPTSMTCFGRLLLPQYSTREVLEERLVKAIENSKGFGAA